MKRTLLALITMIAACTSSPSEPDPGGSDAAPPSLFSPVGAWDMVITMGSGTCGLTGTANEPVSVEPDGSTFVATTDMAGQTVTGTVEQTQLDATIDIAIHAPESVNGMPDQVTISIDATADTSDAIVGTGTATSVTSTQSCEQAFTVAGTLTR